MNVLRCFVLLFIIVNSHAQFRERGGILNISNFGSNYGVSVADLDKDALEDIYIACRANEQNLLYKNNKDNFNKPTSQISFSGNSTNSILFDYDNDGFLDIYIGNAETANLLYRNNGDGSFSNVTAEAGVGSRVSPLSLMAGDLNNDGWLDLYVANPHVQNELYLNNGDGTFKDFTLQSGALDTQIAMGSLFFDYDNDGDLDIYLTHDSNQPNILYQNQGDATFVDVSEKAGVNYAGFGMGVDFADFNRDGWLDLYITNLYENTLLINNGDGTFSDLSEVSGTDDYGMGWGTNCFDYNNDGWVDIYVVNNSYFSDYPNILYKNNGDLTFSDASAGTDLESRYAGYGSATFDIENDGDLDLVVSNSGSQGGIELFVNEGNDNNWIGFVLEGTESNRSAIGTRAEVYINDIKLIDEIAAGTGYASQSSLKLHFGLGNAAGVDSIVFKWPSGIVDTYYNLAPNQYYKGVEAKSISRLDEVTSTENEIEKNEALIYPNPMNDFLEIRLPESLNQKVEATFFNSSGNIIKNLQFNTSENHQQQIDLQNLTPGLYILKLNTGEKSIVRKLIKQ